MVPFLSQNLTKSFKINFQFKVKKLKIDFETYGSIFKQNLVQPISWLKTIDMVSFLSQYLTISFKINFQFKVKKLKINFETYGSIFKQNLAQPIS